MKQEVIPLEVDPSATVGECKAQIEERVGQPASKIKFILKGKILADTTAVADLNLGPSEFIVVHCAAAKPAAPPPAAAAARPAPAPDPAPAAAPAPPPPSTPSTSPTAAPLPNIPAAPPPAASGVRLLPDAAPPPENEETITALMQLGLGYGRTDAIAALRAAYGDANRAAQYLESGQLPPESELDENPQTEGLRRLIIQYPGAVVNLIASIANGRPEQAAQVRQNPEQFVRELRLDPDSFPPGLFDQIRAGTAQPLSDPGFLQAAQQMNRAGAQQAGGYGQATGAGGGYGQAGPGAAGGGGGAGAASQRPAGGGLLAQFSEAEKEDIKQLQSLGNFPLPHVVQLYLAADKQVDRAANLLFEMM